MIIRDRQEIENHIKSRTSSDCERVINIDAQDFEAVLACEDIAAIEVEAEDFANIVVTILREMREIGCSGTKHVCNSAFGCSRAGWLVGDGSGSPDDR